MSLKQYIEAAVWSSVDDDGNPLDRESRTFSEEAVEKMKNDYERFIKQAEPIVEGLQIDETDLAHDFWLTRNRHGAGFWDRGYPDDIGEALTDLAHSFGECHLYVGDDNLLYIE